MSDLEKEVNAGLYNWSKEEILLDTFTKMPSSKHFHTFF